MSSSCVPSGSRSPQTRTTGDVPPPAKKRRLLPFDTKPKQKPTTLQDGRMLKVEPKQGQWPAHVFLDIECTPTLTNILQQARELLQSHSDRPVHPIDRYDATLHISLSRDLYLRSNQRDPLKRAAQTVSTSQSSSFPISFGRFCKLVNENDSRAFLAVEVGGGWNEVHRLVRKLDAELVRPPLSLPTAVQYYDPPILHASFAWSAPNQPPDVSQATQSAAQKASDLWSDSALEEVQKDLQIHLRKQTFEASHVCVKLGQELRRYPFDSSAIP